MVVEEFETRGANLIEHTMDKHQVNCETGEASEIHDTALFGVVATVCR